MKTLTGPGVTPEDLADAIAWQMDARSSYAQADKYRDAGGSGPWVASKMQEVAAHSAAMARLVLCGGLPPVYDRPCAAPGLTSYRCAGPFGWIMIGATDDADALREARRSTANPKPEALQRWDGRRYVPTTSAPPPHAQST